MSATFNSANPSLGNATNPATIPVITGAGWGIENTLTGCIIQSEQIEHTKSTDPTYDQKGALVHELDYDESWTLNLSFICNDSNLSSCVWLSAATSTTPTAVGDTQFTYGGQKWKIDSLTYNGAYNQKKQYSITAHRSLHFPV